MTRPHAYNSTLPTPSHPMKRSPLAKTSKKQRAKNRVYEAAKKVVRERSGGRCEHRDPPIYEMDTRCTDRATEFHHLQRRSQGGLHTPENLLHLCAGCHASIHANPSRSYANGTLIRSSPLAGREVAS